MSAGAGQTAPPDRATPRYSDKWSGRVMVFRGAIGQAGDMQAEELDDLVQHLAVAKYALEADETARAAEALDAAMVIARRGLTRNQAERGPAAPVGRTPPSAYFRGCAGQPLATSAGAFGRSAEPLWLPAEPSLSVEP